MSHPLLSLPYSYLFDIILRYCTLCVYIQYPEASLSMCCSSSQVFPSLPPSSVSSPRLSGLRGLLPSSDYDSLCSEEGEERRNPIPQLCLRGWRSKLRRNYNSRRYPLPGVVSFWRLSKSPCVESQKYEFALLSSVGWRSIVLGLEWKRWDLGNRGGEWKIPIFRPSELAVYDLNSCLF